MGTQETIQRVEAVGRVRDGEEVREGRAYEVGDQGGRACGADGEGEGGVTRLQERGGHRHPLAGVPSE